jgi:hypothetical protein
MKVNANNTHTYKHIFHTYMRVVCVCVCNMRVASHIEFALLIQSIALDTATLDHDRLL